MKGKKLSELQIKAPTKNTFILGYNEGGTFTMSVEQLLGMQQEALNKPCSHCGNIGSYDSRGNCGCCGAPK